MLQYRTCIAKGTDIYFKLAITQLKEAIGPTVVHEMNRHALRQAAQGGHLEVLKWARSKVVNGMSRHAGVPQR